MGKFDGILICTDLDGTLYKNDKSISRENLDAIEYFKSEGGVFTFITGRMPYFSKDVYEILNPNGPFGCCNGGGVYDHRTGEYLWKRALDRGAFELVEYAQEVIPEIGVQINCFTDIYFTRENAAMKKFREITGVANNQCSMYDVSDDIGKIVFGDLNTDNIEKLSQLLPAHPKAYLYDFVRPEKILFDILPKGISKGDLLTRIARFTGTSPDRTVAVGDYYNDISMINAARVGVAVANACEDAKKAADIVTVSNEENAIKRIIDDIDSGIISF